MSKGFSNNENFIGYVMGNGFELKNKGNYLWMDFDGLVGHVCGVKQLWCAKKMRMMDTRNDLGLECVLI